MKKYLLAPLAMFCLNWSSAALSADFAFVRIEAEDFTSKSDRWVLTSPDSTPDVQPDPDPPHNGNASGNANLELLPDSRVTHADDVVNGGIDGNFWGGPGGGPRIDYDVFVPEAGRYFVYVKTYSTGTEDNGIHVGVNGTLPQSGQRIQICSKHNWFWTSGQRTDADHCGVTKTIWLDFPEAGVNTVTFFAREDGFEIDQFLLLKETHDGSKDCFPTFNDKIRCRDIATGENLGDTEMPFSQTVDGDTVITPPAPPETTEPEIVEVDLGIDLDVVGSTHYLNDPIEYKVRVQNNHAEEPATNVVATMNLANNLVFNTSAACTVASSVVTCDFGTIAANSTETMSFTASTPAEGDYRIDAQVDADQEDFTGSNDTDSETISASAFIPDFDAGISIAQRTNVSSIGGANTYTVTVINNGLLEIPTSMVKLTTGAGISVQPSDNCNLDCTVEALPPGESTVITFDTIATENGTFAISATVTTQDDANDSNNTASLSETVIASVASLSDNGNIVIEAESFSTSSIAATENAPQWFLVDDNFTPMSAQLDPDNASPLGVSGEAYVELLPDLRIDDNSASITDATNFKSGGVGATLTYNVFFSTAGTYHVYARIRANNNQDSSLHVGLDNDWQQTSTSVSVCNPDGSWQWTNNLRTDSGCSTSSVATLSVDQPGSHVLMVSQDTDGLELDKLILGKDPIEGLTGNGPAATNVSSTPQADISITSTLSEQQVAPGDAANLVITLNNQSANDASGLTVTISGADLEPVQSEIFDSCTVDNGNLACALSSLAANQELTETFTINTTEAETKDIVVSVSTIQSDANTQNDTDQASLKVASSNTSTGGGSFSVWFTLSVFLLLLLHGYNKRPVLVKAVNRRR